MYPVFCITLYIILFICYKCLLVESYNAYIKLKNTFMKDTLIMINSNKLLFAALYRFYKINSLHLVCKNLVKIIEHITEENVL